MTERVYLAPEGVAPAGSPRISILWEPYSADNTGATDTTAAFNGAAAAGAVDIAPGTYLLNGLLDVSGAEDFTGVGMSNVVFKLGLAGQIRIGQAGGGDGAAIGGFTVDGQGAQNLSGGGFHVVGRNMARYRDIRVKNCLGDCAVIEAAQNCTWINFHVGQAGRSSLVFDNGCGGMRFYGGEVEGGCLYGIEIRQSKVSTGGYPTFLGPSDIHWHGTIFEYPGADTLANSHGGGTGPHAVAPGMFYVSAGGDHSLIDCAINMQNMIAAGSNLIMEPGAQSATPVATATVTAWDGANNITLNDATGITALMSAKVPGCPPETITNNVVGNVVTINSVPTSSPVGAAVAFGALVNDITLAGETALNGTSGQTTAIDLRGGTTVYANGRIRFQGHQNTYKMRSTDTVVMNGTPYYQSATNIEPQQQAGDTGTWASDQRVIDKVDGTVQATTRWGVHRAFIGWRRGDGYPHTIITPGTVSLSDGASNPSNLALQYLKDTAGLEWANVPATAAGLQAQILKAAGLGGISGPTRILGQLTASGSPTTGTWNTGDEFTGPNGIKWICITAGTPGTWINAADARSWDTITINPLLAGQDAALKVGTWSPNLDAAAIGNGWLWNNSGAINDEIGFDLVLAKGTYTVSIMFRKAPSQVNCTVSLDGASVGSINQFAAAQANNQQGSVAGVVVAQSGKHRISFKAAAAGFIVLQLIQIRQTA